MARESNIVHSHYLTDLERLLFLITIWPICRDSICEQRYLKIKSDAYSIAESTLGSLRNPFHEDHHLIFVHHTLRLKLHHTLYPANIKLDVSAGAQVIGKLR